MKLHDFGLQIRERRQAKQLTLSQLASIALVSRSTLAALESGKLAELGFSKVVRLCAAVELVVDIRPFRLDAPLMPHRHLTDVAGRELTKAAIDDVISRGDVSAWRGLVRAIRSDDTGRLARRVQDVAFALREHDPKARAFAAMLPKFRSAQPGKGIQRG
jgi:transcriptional regulator with XRE-family HTH domain